MSTWVRTAVLDCDCKYCVRDKVCPAVGKCGIGVSSIVVGTRQTDCLIRLLTPPHTGSEYGHHTVTPLSPIANTITSLYLHKQQRWFLERKEGLVSRVNMLINHETKEVNMI